MGGIWHSILDFFGVINEGGKGYGFWSGIGSDIGEFALIGAVVAVYRKHNCHVQKCWRISRHAVEGTPWIVCRKHHPTIQNVAPTAEQVVSDHHAAKTAQAATTARSDQLA